MGYKCKSLLEQAFRNLPSVIEIRTSDPFVPNEVRYRAAPITNAGRILLRRYALVKSPASQKCLLIGEKASRPG